MNRKAFAIFAAVAVITVSVYIFKNGTPDNAAHADTASTVSSAEVPETTAAEESDEEVETPEIEIPVEAQQLIGVKTTSAAVRSLENVIRTVGRIEYNERGLATVSTKVDGWIEKLYIDYTGRPVRKGEPLAELYSPELVAAQEEHLVAMKWATGEGSGSISVDSSTLLEASRKRLQLWDISNHQIETLEKTGEVRRTLTIYSPVSGYVIDKKALQGMRVMAGEKLFDVADLSTVWILADIYEYEIPLVRVNERVKMRLSYFPGRTFESKVDFIYPTLSEDTRTAKVRIELRNIDNELKPNMFSDIEMLIPLGERLSVPSDAVIDTGLRHIVYVDKGDGYFEPREVLIGQRADGYIEVIVGLSEGEIVASSANFLIDSEAQFRGVKPLPLKNSDNR